MARKAPTFAQLKEEYTRLYSTMKIKQSWVGGVTNVASKIKRNKDRYQAVSDSLGGNIPWQFIGVIHNLECGLSFYKHLHNGDSLGKRTYRVPAGRPKNHDGPFTFEESAIDALKMKGFDKITDWSPARMCYELEKYNGWGYRLYHPTTLSPYLWSGSVHYNRGKYIADGKWSSSAVSKQMGAIPVLKYLSSLEKPEKVSTKHSFLKTMEKIVPAGGITMAVMWQTLEKVKTFMADNSGIILLSVAVLAFLAYVYIKMRMYNDLQEGRYVPSGLVEVNEPPPIEDYEQEMMEHV